MGQTPRGGGGGGGFRVGVSNSFVRSISLSDLPVDIAETCSHVRVLKQKRECSVLAYDGESVIAVSVRFSADSK